MSLTIKLVRIDDRLIHGQVATVWAKQTGVNRIFVVNDDVAKDEFRKKLLKQATPPGVKANIVTVQKLIDVYPDDKYNDFKVMLIFTNPSDILTAVEGGVPIQSVNVGGMAFSDGKKKLTTAVSVTADDVQAFKSLDSKGVELEIRQVINDKPVNLAALI